VLVDDEAEGLGTAEETLLASRGRALAEVLRLQEPQLLLVQPILYEKYLRHLEVWALVAAFLGLASRGLSAPSSSPTARRRSPKHKCTWPGLGPRARHAPLGPHSQCPGGGSLARSDSAADLPTGFSDRCVSLRAYRGLSASAGARSIARSLDRWLVRSLLDSATRSRPRRSTRPLVLDWSGALPRSCRSTNVGPFVPSFARSLAPPFVRPFAGDTSALSRPRPSRPRALSRSLPLTSPATVSALPPAGSRAQARR
jgi:hypothetical protein